MKPGLRPPALTGHRELPAPRGHPGRQGWAVPVTCQHVGSGGCDQVEGWLEEQGQVAEIQTSSSFPPLFSASR